MLSGACRLHSLRWFLWSFYSSKWREKVRRENSHTATGTPKSCAHNINRCKERGGVVYLEVTDSYSVDYSGSIWNVLPRNLMYKEGDTHTATLTLSCWVNCSIKCCKKEYHVCNKQRLSTNRVRTTVSFLFYLKKKSVCVMELDYSLRFRKASVRRNINGCKQEGTGGMWVTNYRRYDILLHSLPSNGFVLWLHFATLNSCKAPNCWKIEEQVV